MFLILGGTGMLGTDLCMELTKLNLPFTSVGSKELDICDELAVRRLFQQIKPKNVINCAAMTDVDKCEEMPEEAERINGRAVANVAKNAKRFNSKFFQISTDYVFDGTKKEEYTEEDQPNPVSEYGKSKLIGEKLALEEDGVVFRVQWLYGAKKPNFVNRLVQMSLDGSMMKVTKSQEGCLCSTPFIAKMLIDLSFRVSNSGLYHLTHDNQSSRYEAARYLVKGIGCDPDQVIEPIVGVNFGKAKRPISTRMSNKKIREIVGYKGLGTWERDLNEYMIQAFQMRLV